MSRRDALTRALRRFAVGPPLDPAERQAFERDRDALLGRVMPWMLGFFVVVSLAWWPFDLIIYADQPQTRAFMGQVRGAVIIHHLAWLTLGRAALRRHPEAWGAFIAIGETWLVAWLGGAMGGLDTPWAYYMYIWPLALMGIAYPLLTRLTLELAMGMGALALYVVSSGTALDHPDLPHTASYMLFCCVFAALVGHGMWLLVRENFVQRRLIEAQRARLDAFRRELEARVEAQTADLQVLTRRLETLREEERGWMAREMNDALAQELTGARFALDLVRTRLSTRGGPLDAALGAVHDRLGHAQASVHAISKRLRPPVLDELGLVAALSWLADDTAARAGLAVEFTAAPPDARLAAALETALYRITQEALSNVLRHAAASRVELRLVVADEHCALTVRDDGVGVDARQGPTGGVGCIGIRERIAALGGRAEWRTPASGGTLLSIDAPCEAP